MSIKSLKLRGGTTSAELLPEFDEALRSAFNYDQLKHLVNYMPGRNFEELVPVKADLRVVVSELLGNARRQGWLFELACAAFKANDGNPKLQQFWTKHQARLEELSAPNIGAGQTTADDNNCSPDPDEVVALVDRGEQKDDVMSAIVNSELSRESPMIFIVKGPLEQLLDLFQTALTIDTIPIVLGLDERSAKKGVEPLEEMRERVVFNPVRWSPRGHSLSRNDWLRRLAIQGANVLGGLAQENFKCSIQDRLNDILVDKRSFLGIQYDLSSRDLNVLHDLCFFWKQFEVKNGIFLILVKIATPSHPYWSCLCSWLSRLWKSTEPNVKHLGDLGNVFPGEVTEWWNLNRKKMPENSPLRADPVADVFVEKREDRHGITMKEFRDRFRR
jgi:hypothetical protein